jgi:hypothetical protein
MPTPFTHLQITHRLLNDPQIPDAVHELMTMCCADFYLGGVVADARSEGSQRADTHFYHYTEPMPDNPWREMFRQHSSLKAPQSRAHKVFLMAYVAHLASDEYWSRNLLKPYIAEADWGKDIYERFKALHLLLIYMDERDERYLPKALAPLLHQSYPMSWLPFMDDKVIGEWRDFIAEQLENNASQTLQIFGSRIHIAPEDIRKMLDDAQDMQRRLWNHISLDFLAEIEERMYRFSREQMLICFDEFFA